MCQLIDNTDRCYGEVAVNEKELWELLDSQRISRFTGGPVRDRQTCNNENGKLSLNIILEKTDTPECITSWVFTEY